MRALASVHNSPSGFLPDSAEGVDTGDLKQSLSHPCRMARTTIKELNKEFQSKTKPAKEILDELNRNGTLSWSKLISSAQHLSRTGTPTRRKPFDKEQRTKKYIYRYPLSSSSLKPESCVGTEAALGMLWNREAPEAKAFKVIFASECR